MANDLSNHIREIWLPDVQELSREMLMVKDVADYSMEPGDGDTFHRPAYSDPTGGEYTRNAVTGGTGAVVSNDVTTTDETLVINQTPYISFFVDRLDQRQMYTDLEGKLKTRSAYKLAYAKNASLLAEYANAGSVVDGTDIGGASGPIVPTTTNALDILEAFKANVVETAGTESIEEFWLSVDSTTYFKVFEKLMTQLGHKNADMTIKNGFKGQLLDINMYIQPKAAFTTVGATTHWVGGYKGAVTFKVQEEAKHEMIPNPANADGSHRLGDKHIIYDLYGKKTYSDGARELCDIEVTV